MTKISKAFLFFICLFSLPGFCSELTISAASSLTNVFKELGDQFTKLNPTVKLQFNFAGSGQLLQQIKQGAPVDIFAAPIKKQWIKHREKICLFLIVALILQVILWWR